MLAWVTVVVHVALGEDAAPATRSSVAERLRITYATPPPALRKNAAPPSSIALDPTDKSVVLLPRYEVRDDRLPFTENDMLTPKGRLAVAKRRTLSPLYQKTFGPISWLALAYFNPLALLGSKPNDAEASALYAQEEEIRRSHEISDLNDLGRFADEAKALEKIDKNGAQGSAETK